MLTVFAALHLKWRSNLAILCAAILLAGLAWAISPQLRATTDRFTRDYQIYMELNQPTSIGTPFGDVTVVLRPDGTRGWDDLRRAANREPLGHGLRPSVASPGDLARMLAASDRDEDAPKLRRLRRLIELERELSRGMSIER